MAETQWVTGVSNSYKCNYKPNHVFIGVKYPQLPMNIYRGWLKPFL